MAGGRKRDAVLAIVGALLGASFAIGSFSGSVPPATASSATTMDLLPPRTGISPVNITLHGNAGGGWGFSNATIAKPGPNITVFLGDDVRLTLDSNDPLDVRHNWFIDYNNDSTPNGDEPR